MRFSQYIITFFMGFFLYSLVEIVGRGYTHWTMSLTGGIIFSALYAINSCKGITLIRSCFVGALLITAVEFAVGIFDNIIMRWEVWDYSKLPLNFMGQICLFFSLYWYILCIPAYYLCRLLRKRFG